VCWRQGFFFVTLNMDTGERSYSRIRPEGVPVAEGKGSARESFSVLSSDFDPPTQRELDMGIVRVSAGGRGLSYARRNTARKSKRRRTRL